MIKLNKKVLISDPCYEIGTFCTYTTDVIPGNYETFVKYSDEGNWGTRVSELNAIHEAFTEDELSWKKVFDDIGVDSGTCGIFDYNKVKNLIGAIEGDDESEEFYEESDPDGDTQIVEVRGFGVVSRTGMGDGTYDLFVGIEPGGEVAGIKVVYLSDEDDEYDEDEYDEYDPDDEDENEIPEYDEEDDSDLD